MTVLRSLALILLLATTAWADTITGTVDLVREPAPGDPEKQVEVALIKAKGGQLFRVTDEASMNVLTWLDREQVTLEGTPGEGLVGGAQPFAVEQLVKPEFNANMQGVVWSTKKGLSGRRTIELADGSQASISGPNFRTLYSLTKDLKKRLITFSGFQLKDRQGQTTKLIVMEVEATMLKDGILSDASFGVLLKVVVLPLLIADPPEVHGDVAKGETVWIERRSLMGGDLKARNADHVRGHLHQTELEIGTVIDDDAHRAFSSDAPKAAEGAVGSLGALDR